MVELIFSMIPLGVAAALQPPQVIALVILLQTGRGVVNGLAYITGMSAFHTLGWRSFLEPSKICGFIRPIVYSINAIPSDAR